MRLLLIVFVVLAVMAVPVPAMAEDGAAKEIKGANEKAYEHANEKAKFKREENWFDAIGKNKKDKSDTDKVGKEEEKEAKKAEKEVKKAEKNSKKVEKEAKKSSKKAEKETKKAAKAAKESKKSKK